MKKKGILPVFLEADTFVIYPENKYPYAFVRIGFYITRNEFPVKRFSKIIPKNSIDARPGLGPGFFDRFRSLNNHRTN